MAKKTSKKKARVAAKPEPAPEPKQAEERASFLPGEQKKEDPKEEIRSDVKTDAANTTPENTFDREVFLKVEIGNDRRLRVTLHIPPLPPWTEEQMWLMPDASAEQKAGRIAETIRAAADQVAQDAPIKHAIREMEEAEAKKRFGERA